MILIGDKTMATELSVIEKATKLNKLRKEVWGGTPTEETTIDVILSEYSKETNIIIDSYIWNLYGLHYKEYIDVIGSYLSYCPVKLEKAIDKSIEYLNEEYFSQK
jgi:hypothetical protein